MNAYLAPLRKKYRNLAINISPDEDPDINIMIEVNLSRIHNMIQTSNYSIQQIKDSLEDGRTKFVLKIMENTTNADQKAFISSIDTKKHRMEAAFQKCLDILSYIEYLKVNLSEGNAKYGISDKLLAASCLDNRLRLLKDILHIKKNGCNEDVNQIQGVDYYKSAFTDYNKIFELEVFMFKDTDVEKMQNEIDRTQNSLDVLKDEIATLNQTKTLSIMTLDEFKENFGKDSVLPKHD